MLLNLKGMPHLKYNYLVKQCITASLTARHMHQFTLLFLLMATTIPLLPPTPRSKPAPKAFTPSYPPTSNALKTTRKYPRHKTSPPKTTKLSLKQTLTKSPIKPPTRRAATKSPPKAKTKRKLPSSGRTAAASLVSSRAAVATVDLMAGRGIIAGKIKKIRLWALLVAV